METLSDIVAEMRRNGDAWCEDKSTNKTECLGLITLKYADRIDAACGRKANCPESVQECGFKLDVLRGVNVAAMPDALARIVELAKAWADSGADAAVTLGLIIAKAESALSKPLRNCDVGTAEEQTARYKTLCRTQKNCNSKCPVMEWRGTSFANCEIAWAQMPYDEGTANRGDLCHED